MRNTRSQFEQKHVNKSDKYFIPPPVVNPIYQGNEISKYILHFKHFQRELQVQGAYENTVISGSLRIKSNYPSTPPLSASFSPLHITEGIASIILRLTLI